MTINQFYNNNSYSSSNDFSLPKLGDYHTSYVDADTGILMVSGDNEHGVLGNGTLEYAQTELQALYKNGDPNQPFINPKSWGFSPTNGAVIDREGKLWTSGRNESGQLGNGTTSTDKQTSFQMVTAGFPLNYIAKEVYLGWGFIVVTLADNSLYVCGHGPHLGLTGDFTNFTKLGLPSGEIVKKIELGANHSAILMTSGDLYTNGQNQYGQLGQTTGSWTTPTLTSVKDFALGFQHTFVLMNDGSVKATGRNDFGQLGLGHKNDISTFTTVPNTPTDIVSIQAGAYHTGILTSSGDLYFTGDDSIGAFGDGPSNSSCMTFTKFHVNVTNFDFGYHHSMILIDGEIKLVGDNYHGALGNGTTTGITDINDPNADISFIINNTPLPPATSIFL